MISSRRLYFKCVILYNGSIRHCTELVIHNFYITSWRRKAVAFEILDKKKLSIYISGSSFLLSLVLINLFRFVIINIISTSFIIIMFLIFGVSFASSSKQCYFTLLCMLRTKLNNQVPTLATHCHYGNCHPRHLYPDSFSVVRSVTSCRNWFHFYSCKWIFLLRLANYHPLLLLKGNLLTNEMYAFPFF